MKTDYDVIIIGAGPAGASCAKKLIDNSKKTLIIEKKKLPREKCCCGLYSDRAISFIKENFNDNIPNSLYTKQKDTYVKFSKTGYVYMDIKGAFFQSLNRMNVDYWLIEQTKSEVIDNCYFINYEMVENKIKVICKLKNNITNFYCNYLVGADGANSRIRRLLDKNYNSNNTGRACQYIYNGDINLDDKYFYVALGKAFTDLAFAWLLKKNDLIYIGVGWLEKKMEYFDNWFNRLKEIYNFSLTLIRKEVCFVENYTGFNGLYFGNQNILIIGEASGLISAFYEGISSSLISGKKGAEAILKTKNNDLIEIYQDNMKDEIEYVKKSWGENIFFK